jgi:hypothetical protein
VKVSARSYKRLHAFLTVFWLLLGIPTMLWWSRSLQWVVWMSLYAVVAAHWSAYQAARSEDNGTGGS